MRALMIVPVALTAILVAGCSTVSSPPPPPAVQRATQGPSSDQVATARFVRDYRRPPTFEEKTAMREATEARILRYFSQRPDIATSARATQIRFQKTVAVGMSKEEVVLLLEQADSITSDVAKMSAAAGSFWPAISKQAKEMWAYPPAWRLYFDGDRLVDVTVAGAAPLE